jgi:hypothetical protein
MNSARRDDLAGCRQQALPENEKPPPLLGANGGGKSTGYGARVARDQGRCRSQWPAEEVKRDECNETRRSFEQRAGFLRKWNYAAKEFRLAHH